MLATRLAGESRRHPRAVGLEDRFASLLPEVLIGIGLDQFARLAAKALEPRPDAEVTLHHIHAPRVSVREQAALVIERLRRSGAMTFRALCGDSPDTLTTVARFLSLLELFREGAVGFDQVSPLGELTVRWTGSDDADAEELVHDEFDGAPPDVPSEEASDPSPQRTSHDPGHSRRRDDRARTVAGGRAHGRRRAPRRDQPGHGGRLLRRRGGGGAPGPDRGLRRPGSRLRAAQRGRWLPLLHARGVRLGRRGLRAGGAAGPAHPGRAGDPCRGRLQAAGVAGPRLGDPRGQRRRRDAHPAHARSGRGGRAGRVVRRDALPDHELLPRADRGDHDRGAARAGALSPGPGRHGGHGRDGGGPRRPDVADPERPRRGPAPSPTEARSRHDRRPGGRRRRAHPPPEAARHLGRRLAPQVRGADARGRGRGGR